MGLIESDTLVTASLFDDEHEEFINKKMTIAEYLDSFTEEGCPQAIEAEPIKHGRWWRVPLEVGDQNHHYVFMSYRCSECKHAFDQKTPYCPWCGARMDKHDVDK